MGMEAGILTDWQVVSSDTTYAREPSSRGLCDKQEVPPPYVLDLLAPCTPEANSLNPPGASKRCWDYQTHGRHMKSTLNRRSLLLFSVTVVAVALLASLSLSSSIDGSCTIRG